MSPNDKAYGIKKKNRTEIGNWLITMTYSKGRKGDNARSEMQIESKHSEKA